MPQTDYETALADPSLAYGTPDKLLADTTLDDARKLELLRRWEADAVHLQESEAEGLDGGEPSLLDQVKRAISTLEG